MSAINRPEEITTPRAAPHAGTGIYLEGESMRLRFALPILLLVSSVLAVAQTTYTQTNLRCQLQVCTGATFSGTGNTLNYQVTGGNVYNNGTPIEGWATWGGVTYYDMKGTTVLMGNVAPFTMRYALEVTFDNGTIKQVEEVNVQCYRGCTQHDFSGSVTE
jgi:hypothetical protein